MQKKTTKVTINPHEAKTPTTKALALLSQNPGLPIETAARAMGIQAAHLKLVVAKHHAISHSRCPTCLRILRPMKNRPLPIDPATGNPLLPPPLTYSNRTALAMKASRDKTSRKTRAAKIKILILAAAARAGFRQPRRRPPPSAYFSSGVRATPPRLSDVGDLL